MVTPVMTRLQFKHKLTGNAAELLKKLKELHTELEGLDQENVDASSLSTVAKALVEPAIANYKDKGVRIYAACCIADLLRLYAPDAPYNKTNLKIIFKLFVNELRHIATPSSTYHDRYLYLLESLSVVKSIVLITDLNNADELMTDLFKNFFDDVRPQQAKNVQIHMSELLQQVIEEASSLPQDIVDIILAQFLHREKYENPAAYRLACDLGNHCAEKLQRYVFQYFSDILSNVGTGELSTKDANDLKVVHKLVVELNKAAPALLLNVIPQLEGELRMDNVTVRSLATLSLGQMFAEKTSQLASQYESTWKAWLLKRNDKSTSIRITWLESLVALIKSQPKLSKELNEGLSEKCIDPDEKVRAVACKIVGELDYETSLHHLQRDTLIQVGHRCRDKKKSVVKEAITSLSVLYNQAYPEIENGVQVAMTQFAWMPSAILHALYVNDAELKTIVDNAVYTIVLPPHGTVAARTQRLLVTFAILDDKGRVGLLSVLRRGLEARTATDIFLRLLQQHEMAKKRGTEMEEIEKKLADFIKIFSEQFPDPLKTSLLLHKYVKVHDETFHQSISDCMDSGLPLREIRKAGRICLTVINKETVSELIKNLGSAVEYRKECGELLRSISLIYPSIFEDQLEEMISLLQDRSASGASDTLHTLAGFAKQFPKSLNAGLQAKEVIQSFLEEGTVIQATHAVIVMASIKDNDRMCRDIAQTSVSRLDETSNHLLRDLTILSQLVLYAPQIFEPFNTTVTDFVVKKLLMRNIPEEGTMYGISLDWVEKSELNEYTLSKIMGLKVLVNRAIVLASDPSFAQEAVRPLFKLLWTLISQDGELVQDQQSSTVLKSYLRLNAARFVLKLCKTRPVYERMVSVFEHSRLALVIQDTVFRVRLSLGKRLIKYIRANELHVRYVAILFLVAHEPEVEWKKIVRTFLVQLSKKQDDNKRMLNELALARLMHLLANHPDFAPKLPSEEVTDSSGPIETHTVNDINLSAKYIEFYLETMATSENISLLLYIATLLKTMRFSNIHETNSNLYTLSDLAQYLIQEKSRIQNWTLTSYPGQVVLPKELYTPLSPEASIENSKKSYLHLEWVRARESRGRPERVPKPVPERRIGQAAKRRSRSVSSSKDGENDSDLDTPAPVRTKRVKKVKTERAPETPTRRMASRAAKEKATAYKDLDSSEELSDEQSSDQD
ncbi:hypothetical protein BGZ94_009542 [Podila epigama]|nr:hypothetical protein BGZ94_009542 [Podila epigama]